MVLAALVAAPLASAQDPVIFDSFGDGEIGDIWVPFVSPDGLTTIQETAGRLVFRSPGWPFGGTFSHAGVVSNGWALDWTQDFQLRKLCIVRRISNAAGAQAIAK